MIESPMHFKSTINNFCWYFLMTLVQLRHFVVLADTGSFVQASAALFLTQPALTRSIQGLEEELGNSLFDRLGRRIVMTPFGLEVLKRARLLVNDAKALKEVGLGLQAGLIGKLGVGLSSGPGALLSVSLMLHMTVNHPKLQFRISRGDTSVLLQALRNQQLDALIVDIRAMRPSIDFKVDLSFEMPAGFLVRNDHPLLRLGRPVSMEEMKVYPIASTPLSEEVARILISRYGSQANPDDLVTIRSDETLSIVDVARQSDAIVLTVTAAGSDLVQLNVSPSLDAAARFGLVTLAKRQEAPALIILRQYLQHWLKSKA